MNRNLKSVFATLALLALVSSQYGCGEGSETNPPSVKLTASTVASSTVSSHTHTVSIPFIDVSAAPPDSGYQYRSDATGGHSHVIALSKQQMVDLDNGMQMTLTSSTPSSGASHTHTWSLQGGNVLYDKNCYNCHSNDNRGRNPMNVSFNSSQTNAVKSPGSAPISSTPAAIPDPNYTQTSETTVNAAAVYAGLCAGCHSLGTVDTVTGIGPNLSGKGALVSGKFPTPGVISHNGQSLTAAQISAMIIYFNAN